MKILTAQVNLSDFSDYHMSKNIDLFLQGKAKNISSQISALSFLY